MDYDFEKELWLILTRLDPMHKPEVIRINISASFMAKARCKFCLSGPDFYYAWRKPYIFENVHLYKRFTQRNKRWIKRMGSDWYKEYQPRTFDGIEEFTFRLDGLQYRPILSRTRGSPKDERNNLLECLGCECGRSVWAFNQKSTKDRPEITNRKGKYGYPKKYIR